ncbi:hypothetical protein V6N11_054097 [Hibiscus sabdariffa]|uniref:RNase H type-1 domain-containing protein n=1 Tax=Hibiscus sabdariffa TaxID=183260 RepID=A0ABR2S3J4_9ROSI
MWNLWLFWNSLVFGNELDDNASVLDCSRRLQETVAATIGFASQNQPRTITPRDRVVWVPPTQGWFKLNSDGAYRASDGRASCGESELRGVYVGLQCSWDFGLRNLLVEVDCLDVLRLLQGEFDSEGAPGIVAHIRDLYDRDWQVVLQHVRREGNKVADAMTRLSMDRELAVSLYYDPPVSLEQLLLANVSG